METADLPGRMDLGGLVKRLSTPRGIRTHGLLIRSQALYPLSYGGVRK